MFGDNQRNSAPALLLTTNEMMLIPHCSTPDGSLRGSDSPFCSPVSQHKLTLNINDNHQFKTQGGILSCSRLLFDDDEDNKQVHFADDDKLATVVCEVETRAEIAPDADKIWHNQSELFVMREAAMEHAKHIRKLVKDTHLSDGMAAVYQWAQDTAQARAEQAQLHGDDFIANHIGAAPEFLLQEWSCLTSDRRGLERNVLQKPLQRSWARKVKAATNVVLDLQEDEQKKDKTSTSGGDETTEKDQATGSSSSDDSETDHSEASSSSSRDSHASLAGGIPALLQVQHDDLESVLRQRYQEASRPAVILALAMAQLDAKIAAGYQKLKSNRSPVKRTSSRKLRRSPRSSPGRVTVSAAKRASSAGEMPAMPVL